MINKNPKNSIQKPTNGLKLNDFKQVLGINKKCECCGCDLKIIYATTKYCTSCSLHRNGDKTQLSLLRTKYNDLYEKYYNLKKRMEKKKC